MGEKQEIHWLAKQAAERKQGREVRLLDLRKLTPMFDYFLFCSADNVPQMKAIEEEVCAALADVKSARKRRQGSAESGWILIDFGDIVVHIFSKEMREFYDLDSRWGEAPELTDE